MNTSSALDPQSPQARVIGGVGVISTIIFVLIFVIVSTSRMCCTRRREKSSSCRAW